MSTITECPKCGGTHIGGRTGHCPYDDLRPCVICGNKTAYACSDCKIETRNTVSVCHKTECRDAHEVAVHPPATGDALEPDADVRRQIQELVAMICINEPSEDVVARIAAFVDERVRAEREANCKAVCAGCRDGLPIREFQYHIDREYCLASPIRALQHTGDGVENEQKKGVYGREDGWLAPDERVGEKDRRDERNENRCGGIRFANDERRTELVDRRKVREEDAPDAPQLDLSRMRVTVKISPMHLEQSEKEDSP